MKKVSSFLIFSIILITLASAQAVEIEKIEKSIVVITELNDPALFQLNIKNNGASDNFEIYSLVGVKILPDERFYIASGETKILDVQAFPNKNIKSKYKGLFQFQYEIYSRQNGITKDNLLINLLGLKDVIEVKSIVIQPGEGTAEIAIKAADIKLEDLRIESDSDFFTFDETLSLKPGEEVNLTVSVNSDEIKSLVAGTYSIDFNILYKSVEAEKKVEVKYLERGGISVQEAKKGFIVRKTTIEKKNEGNVPTTAAITQRKDIITRLLTSSSPNPTSLSKKGFYVTYVWEKELAPNESLQVTTTTNYTLPLIIIVIIILILILLKLFLMTPLSISKKVSHVRTKGGEFALKVTLHVRAKSGADSITLSDHVPHSLKLYNKFGSKPDALDEKTRSIKWNIPRLNAGEERVFSYIMYSKLRVIGKFELPLAHASYTHAGKQKHATSNKAIFLSESLRREE